MAARPSSRQWVGVGIVAIQMAAWCVVGVLLIHRGATNLQRHESRTLMVFLEVEVNETLNLNDSVEVNSTVVSPSLSPVQPSLSSPPPAKAVTAIVMVVIGAIMLVVGPVFLLVKIVDVFQRQRKFIKLSTVGDPPPSYDEVAEKAPRYSALFHVDADGSFHVVSPGASTSDGTSQAPTTSQPLL